jgi:hypothetical protein
MNDNGFPLTTELNVLQALIMKPTILNRAQAMVGRKKKSVPPTPTPPPPHNPFVAGPSKRGVDLRRRFLWCGHAEPAPGLVVVWQRARSSAVGPADVDPLASRGCALRQQRCVSPGQQAPARREN